MRILGLAGGFGHDAAAALIDDGELVLVVEEERVTRRKYARGEIPGHSSIACVRTAGIELADIDVVATAWDAGLDPSNDRLRLSDRRIADSKLLRPLRRNSRWMACDHHQTHAVSAYCLTGMTGRAAVLVMDGRGERCSTSVHHVDEDAVETISVSPLGASLGTFYAAATDYCGFGYGGQGKTMGLAAFGRPGQSVPGLRVDGMAVSLDWEGSVGDWLDDPTDAHRRVLREWGSRLSAQFGPARDTSPMFDVDRLALGVSHDFADQHAQAAAAVQATIEGLVKALVTNIHLAHPGLPILVAGGVALNCTTNGMLRRSFPEVDLRFVPVPHDTGTSIGAAVLAARAAGQRVRGGYGAYLGLGWTDDHIAAVLGRLGLRYSQPADIAEATAQLILDGSIVGWFQSRAEIGPRALGHRSILANPFDDSIRDRLNIEVKGRERWRPFAPSVRAADMQRLFGVPTSPYMIEAHTMAPSAATALPAVVHVDRTARPQSTDSPDLSPRFSALVEAMARQTGTGVVLNTSFNVGAEPVVLSALDALRTFYTSPVDALVIGPYLIDKAQKQ